jgi:phosphoribosylglycinamide formyltransferase-1
VKTRVAVLASGSGTNLQALIDACKEPSYPAEIGVVISDRLQAYALERARSAGIEAVAVPRRAFPDREAHDLAIVELLRARGVQWVCHAGYMRIVGAKYLEAFPWRVLNIHPSLLPAFPGLHAQQQAHAAGVRIAGCTVHLADEGVDTGPILAQGAVPALPTDTPELLQARILRMEHRLYPMVLRWAAEDRIRMEGRQVLLDLPPQERAYLWDGREEL